MKIALAVILALVFLASVLLINTLRGIPSRELRRQARDQRDKKLENMYKLSAFGKSSQIFVWLVGGWSAVGLALLAAYTDWRLGYAVGIVVVWLAWMSRPVENSESRLFRLSRWLAPILLPLIGFLQPILSRFPARVLTSTRLYEKEDLIEFLKSQTSKAGNRISEDELKAAAKALNFNDQSISRVMTPRRKIKWVAAGDSIGPMVMDELHKSGDERFPVVKQIPKSGNPEVVGSLYLKNLLNHLEDKGHIRDIMQPGAAYINESQSLQTATDAFLKSGQLLLIVVNEFEEIVGILALEEVLAQIFGRKIAGEEFDNYADMRAVASLDLEKDDSPQLKTEVE
ncbi:MAG TPA: CBS domain-containing protein [Candidatus Saccharimonadales bacterium]|nr:CBS domain-containing protein [Candidatus Saccharimonadales bacterium]